MDRVLENSVQWPTFPLTVLLLVCCLYWLIVILGFFDVDVFDLDLDMEAEFDLGSPAGIGFYSLKFLNLGKVPLMLWASIFALSGWLASMLLDHTPRPDTTAAIAAAIGRSVGVALVATKLLTTPLKGRFDQTPLPQASDFIGCDCTITSMTATADFGQATLDTQAAPLRLNVRTRGETIPAGSTGRIVDYDPETNTYVVGATDVPSPVETKPEV